MGTRGPIGNSGRQSIQYTAGRPKAPAWLSEDGRREYVRAARLMGDTLTLADMATLAMYAEAYADFARLTIEIRKEGVTVVLTNGVVASNAKCAQRDAAAKRMQSAAAKLGFSPVDRARVPASSKVAKDEFDQFVK